MSKNIWIGLNKYKLFALPLVLLLTLLLVLPNLRPGFKVTRVFDGDTFQLANGEKVRLWGVDAPELGLCGANEATSTLKKLLLNKTVTVKTAQFERYSRRLALVYSGQELINSSILRSGWAAYDGSAKPEHAAMSLASKTARAAKRGIYSAQCYQKENTLNSNCNIKGNVDRPTKTKTYHLPSCREYQFVVIELNWGEQWFCTEAEAKAAGYQKAGHCP